MVDELDRTAFGVLLPEIRDHFGLDTNGILTVVALSLLAALILALPVGFYADRWKRVPIAATGASVWGFFSVLTGLANNLWVLGAARRAPAWAGRSTTRCTTRCWPTTTTSPPGPAVAVHRYANAWASSSARCRPASSPTPSAGGRRSSCSRW